MNTDGILTLPPAYCSARTEQTHTFPVTPSTSSRMRYLQILIRNLVEPCFSLPCKWERACRKNTETTMHGERHSRRASIAGIRTSLVNYFSDFAMRIQRDDVDSADGVGIFPIGVFNGSEILQ